MIEKILFILMIIYLSVFVASILKLQDLVPLSLPKILLAFFVPLFLIIYVIHFYIFLKKKFPIKKSFLEQIYFTIRLIKYEIRLLPIMHSGLIDIICSILSEGLIKDSLREIKEIFKQRLWEKKANELTQTISRAFIF